MTHTKYAARYDVRGCRATRLRYVGLQRKRGDVVAWGGGDGKVRYHEVGRPKHIQEIVIPPSLASMQACICIGASARDACAKVELLPPAVACARPCAHATVWCGLQHVDHAFVRALCLMGDGFASSSTRLITAGPTSGVRCVRVHFMVAHARIHAPTRSLHARTPSRMA